MNKILIDYQGQKLSIKEIAKLNGLNFQVLTNKYKKTGDINEAVENLKVTQLGPVKYLDFFGQKMTINQIAKMYGIRRETLDYVYKSISDIDEAVSFCINNDCTSEAVCEQKIKMQKNTVSIDKLKNLDKSSFPETSLKSNDNTLLNNRQDAIEIAENNVLTEDINKVLQMLPVREEKVLRARYGLDDGYQLDVKEIAKIHGVSTARIRQIEEKALRRLRHPKLSSFFSNYFLLAERIKAERIKLGLDK
ncbi:MAG: sigma-70 family RNA polymerase sigma factor [Clostridia bacterium]|nr:sigma-70 family RNA polymerase sigma factor [Clostridia bacterium]